MWLGRIDFFLTPPPVSGEPEWTKEEIRRMHLAPQEYSEIINDIPNLVTADQLLSDDIYDPYYSKVTTQNEGHRFYKNV